MKTFCIVFGSWLGLIMGLTLLMQYGCYKGNGPKMPCNPAQVGCVPQLDHEPKPTVKYERH